MCPLTAYAGQQMKRSPNLIGLGSGLVTAVLIASLANTSVLALLLSYLVPLPMFLAGIGWGVWAGAVSLMSATLMLALLQNTQIAFYHIIFIGSPALILIYLLHMHRVYQLPPAGGNADGNGGTKLRIEWYPFGHLVAWGGVMAGALVSLALLQVSGGDVDQYVKAVGEAFGESNLSLIQEMFGGNVTLEQTGKLLAYFLPSASAQAWLAMMIVNLWIATKCASISSLLIRPFPSIRAIEYPPFLGAGFFAALVISFAPGLIGLFGSAFTGALGIAFVLLGLTVIHALLAQSPYRVPVLIVLYTSLFWPSLSHFVALPLLGLGLAESFLHLRQRKTQQKLPPSDHSGQD